MSLPTRDVLASQEDGGATTIFLGNGLVGGLGSGEVSPGLKVKNKTGSTLSPGTVVTYQIDSAGEAVAVRSDALAHLLATHVVREAIAVNAEGNIYEAALIERVAGLGSLSKGQAFYLSEVAGEVTTDVPADPTSIVQKVGYVVDNSSVYGSVILMPAVIGAANPTFGDITSVIAGPGLVGTSPVGTVTLASGLEITNKSGATLNPGEVVFVEMIGAVLSAYKVTSGGKGPPYALYVVKESIAVDAIGNVYGTAQINGLNTAAFSVGDYLALSPTAAGGWVSISGASEFNSDETVDVIGLVTISHAVQGEILFFPGATYTIEQPLDVALVRQFVMNDSGVAFSDGDLVGPVSGSTGFGWRTPCFAKADANAGIPATHVCLTGIPSGSFGNVYSATMVGNLNTNAGNGGDLVYLSTTAGGWTLTPPTGPNDIQQIVGVITVKSLTVGKIYFFPSFGTVKKLPASSLQEGVLQYAEVELTKANILAMFGAPVSVVSAPGADKAIEFLSAAVIYDFATAAYGGGGDVTLGYTGGSALSSTVSAANSFGAAGDKVTGCQALDTAGGTTLLVNTGLSITNAAGAFTDPGTAAGVGRLKIVYRVHKLDL